MSDKTYRLIERPKYKTRIAKESTENPGFIQPSGIKYPYGKSESWRDVIIGPYTDNGVENIYDVAITKQLTGQLIQLQLKEVSDLFTDRTGPTYWDPANVNTQWVWNSLYQRYEWECYEHPGYSLHLDSKGTWFLGDWPPLEMRVKGYTAYPASTYLGINTNTPQESKYIPLSQTFYEEIVSGFSTWSNNPDWIEIRFLNGSGFVGWKSTLFEIAFKF